MKYEWKRNKLGNVAAEDAAKEIEALTKKHNNTITPKQIVEAAKTKKSPIHDCFEWEDSIAAEKYRQDQARYILRNIVIVYEEEDKEPFVTRFFVSIKEDVEPHYATIKKVATDEEMYAELLSQAYEDLKAFRLKYKRLRELKDLIDMIDGFFEK